jgi:hypothetical protein
MLMLLGLYALIGFLNTGENTNAASVTLVAGESNSVTILRSSFLKGRLLTFEDKSSLSSTLGSEYVDDVDVDVVFC